MSEENIDKRFVPTKHFWIIKGSLIFFMILATWLTGFFAGGYNKVREAMRMQEVARDEMKRDFPQIALIQAGEPFCQNQGNTYPAKIIPRKNKSLLPFFVAVQTEEF